MSLRTLNPKQALALLLKQKEALGISRLADISRFVDLKVNVVQAVRTTLIKGQVSATTGKGWSINQALCGALGEALERYCAAYPPPLCPEHYSLPLASLTGFGHPSGFLPEDICHARELFSDRSCLLPALEVNFPYHGTDLAKTTLRPHTSGLASGATLTEATLFGLFEVIERHASSRFFQRFKTAATGTLIRDSSINDNRIRKALDDLSLHGYETFVFRINALLPTYYVAILDTANLGPKFMVAGVSSHLNENQALDSALLEAMQAIVIAAQGTREDLTRYTAAYQGQKIGNDNPFYRIKRLLADLNPSQDFPTMAVMCPQIDAAEALDNLLQRLQNTGIHAVYQCDLSRMDWPLRVIKIIVPGMFDTHINPERDNDAASST